MQHLENVTADEYIRLTVVENPGVVFVKFTADWCQPCKTIAPYVHDRVDWVNRIDGAKKVLFLSVDIDKNTEIFRKLSRPPFKIMVGVPAFLLYEKKDLGVLRALSKTDAIFPDDMALGADMTNIERLFVSKVHPAIDFHSTSSKK